MEARNLVALDTLETGSRGKAKNWLQLDIPGLLPSPIKPFIHLPPHQREVGEETKPDRPGFKVTWYHVRQKAHTESRGGYMWHECLHAKCENCLPPPLLCYQNIKADNWRISSYVLHIGMDTWESPKRWHGPSYIITLPWNHHSTSPTVTRASVDPSHLISENKQISSNHKHLRKVLSQPKQTNSEETEHARSKEKKPSKILEILR